MFKKYQILIILIISFSKIFLFASELETNKEIDKLFNEIIFFDKNKCIVNNHIYFTKINQIAKYGDSAFNHIRFNLIENFDISDYTKCCLIEILGESNSKKSADILLEIIENNNLFNKEIIDITYKSLYQLNINDGFLNSYFLKNITKDINYLDKIAKIIIGSNLQNDIELLLQLLKSDNILIRKQIINSLATTYIKADISKYTQEIIKFCKYELDNSYLFSPYDLKNAINLLGKIGNKEAIEILSEKYYYFDNNIEFKVLIKNILKKNNHFTNFENKIIDINKKNIFYPSNNADILYRQGSWVGRIVNFGHEGLWNEDFRKVYNFAPGFDNEACRLEAFEKFLDIYGYHNTKKWYDSISNEIKNNIMDTAYQIYSDPEGTYFDYLHNNQKGLDIDGDGDLDEFDCVGFVEYCYESNNLDIISNDDSFYLTPEIQFNSNKLIISDDGKILNENKNKIYEPWPNPFNNSTIIPYKLYGNINNPKIKIFNILGELIYTIPLEEKEGTNKMTLFVSNCNKGNLSSGIYIISLEVDGKIKDTKKILYIK